METIAAEQIFKPILLPRKGEVTAWILAMVSGGTWLLLVASDRTVYYFLPIFFFFFLFSATLISFSNWNDRKMFIRITPKGVTYESGIKRIEMNWEEVNCVEVFSSSWGKKVLVFGSEDKFNFRTLGKVSLRGQEKGSMGFREGEKIQQIIVKYAELNQIGVDEKKQVYSKRMDPKT